MTHKTELEVLTWAVMIWHKHKKLQSLERFIRALDLNQLRQIFNKSELERKTITNTVVDWAFQQSPDELSDWLNTAQTHQ